MDRQEAEKPVIVLDAGRVLIDFDLNVLFDELTRIRGQTVGFPLPPELEALFAKAELESRAWYAIPPALNGTLGIALETEQWRELWCRIFTGEVSGMREVLAELKREFRLVALSNTCQVHWEFIVERYPIFGLLDGWVFSYEEGLAKPDPAIYQVVMDRYTGNRPPFLYTDDMPQYVEAARRLGWRAAVFEDALQFREEVGREL
jgi:FMN phosphatase YigB (HAD superfamily)